MKKTWVSYFRGVGVLELIVALFPIVAGYGNVGLIWAILMIVVSLMKRCRPLLNDKAIVICFLYVILHSIVIISINDFDGTAINRLFGTTIYLLAIIIVPSAIRYEKMVSSLYLIAIIASIGLIFQLVQILAGHPIALPVLPAPDEDSRLWAEMGRPSSFFWEPSSFVIYVMFPLFISLMNKRVPLSIFFFLCILLSTSSNGIFMAPIMLAVYVFTSSSKKSNKVLVAIAMAAIMVFFFKSSIFDIGKVKIENTEFSENARLANGPKVVSAMPVDDLIFGIPKTTIEKYAMSAGSLSSFISSKDSLFLSDFWYVMVVYGVVGLLLHLLVYFRLIKLDKSLLPYVVVLLIAQFTQSISFRSMYVYQMICVWSYVIYHKTIKYTNNYV